MLGTLGPAEDAGENQIMSNKQTFQDTLTRHYRELFTTPAFAYAASGINLAS